MKRTGPQPLGLPGRPPRGVRGRDRLAGWTLLVIVIALGGGSVAGSEASAEPSVPGLPEHQGGDLSQPIQEAFRDWPPEELKQRAYWLPWSWTSFQKAALFGRPVLFVMAPRWSRATWRMMEVTLSDPRVLTAINESYVSVLIDPDRRPDIRERYQTGVWPVVAFLLPDGNPMLSQANDLGVARPITTGSIGIPQMLFMLREGDVYYDQWAGLLKEVGREWHRREGAADPSPGDVNQAASDSLAEWLLANADRQNGSFGVAPKFVQPGLYEYGALRMARLVPAIGLHARLTLEKLLDSPLYDSRDGGVHRLSAAPAWGDIQYEKMLESNSHLLRELVLATRMKSTPELRVGVQQTAGFITRVLGRPGGGFYLAQCADRGSVDGGRYWRDGEPTEPPPLDPLVLAGPNALAGAALIRAGSLLEEEGLERAGAGAIALVLERAYRAGRGADHVIEPNPEQHRLLWPQADVAFGLVDAYQTTGDPKLLAAARDVVDFAWNNLRLEDSALLFDHLPGPMTLGLLANPRQPVRPNVRLARAMLRLAALGQGEDYRQRAISILGAVAGDLAAYRLNGPELGLAVEEATQEPLLVELRGDPRAAATRALGRAAVNVAWPWTIISWAEEGEQASATLRWDGKTATAERPAQLETLVKEMTGGALPGADG